jgi:5'-nucleotidase
MPAAERTTPLRILVTNDDGIYAPGLAVLEKVAHALSSDVWVVAPEVEQSGAGHSLSLQSPLRFQQLGEQRFSVRGTPTDCVLMAARVIVPGTIDLVLSGINRGGNIAEDITHSGTIAAAMEGTLCDIPSIAFSQSFDFGSEAPAIQWETAEAYAHGIITRLLKQPWERDTMFNVNFPDCPPEEVKGIKLVAHGKRGMPKKLTPATDPKGRPYYWLNWADESIDPRRPDTDIKWIKEHYITITPLCLDLTNYSLLERLKPTLEA